MEKVTLHYDEASWLSKWMMAWPFFLIKHFRKTPPTIESLPEIPKTLKFDQQYETLCQNWEEERSKPNPSFFKALMKTIKSEYLLSALLAGIYLCMCISQILIVGLMIGWLKDNAAEHYIGFLYLFAFAINNLIALMCLNSAIMNLMLIISKTKSFVCLMISEKVHKISYDILLSENNSAKIINIVGTDIELLEMMNLTLPLLGLPILVILTLVTLWFYIDYAGLIGVAIIVLHSGILMMIGKMNLKVRLSIASITDSRIKMITNLIEGLKIVKLYGWEFPFLSLIANERILEIMVFMKLAMIIAVQRFITVGLIPLCVFVSIIIYIYDNGSISLEDAIITVSLLYICNVHVLYNFTGGIRSFFILTAACSRIGDTLLMKEIEEKPSSTYSYPKLKLRDASFCWSRSKEETENPNEKLIIPSRVLSGISFSVKSGEVLVVAGPIGSGKSSLLAGILEEIFLVEGSVRSNRSFSYSSDNPWIISDTVKENILMGLPFDNNLYMEALQYSELLKDLQSLDNSDETIVGDRGITLSGGQKARIGLARAIYADRDILLLDDPLSAVDSEVSSSIFNNLTKLAEKGKAIVLVTHQIHTLSYADKILILNAGQQFFYGDYYSLKRLDNVDEVLGDLVEGKENQKKKKKGENNAQIQSKQQEVGNEIEEKEKIVDTVPFKMYFRYLKLGYKNTFFLVLIILLLIVSQVVILSVNFWVGVWASSDDQQDPYFLYVALGITFAVYFLCFFRLLLSYYVLITANKHLHNQSLTSLTLTNSVFFDKNPTGRILNRFTKDMAITDENLLFYLSESINLTCFLIGYILIMTILSPGTLVGILLYVE